MTNSLEINHLIEELHENLLNKNDYILYSFNEKNKLPKFVLELNKQKLNFYVKDKSNQHTFKIILNNENNTSKTNFKYCFDINLKQNIFLKSIKQFSANIDSKFMTIYKKKSSNYKT
jgi:hypothetical protein